MLKITKMSGSDHAHFQIRVEIEREREIWSTMQLQITDEQDVI